MKNTILVVEDDPITRMDLVEILKENGYEDVIEATNGADAVELGRLYKPSLALVDFKMPILDGLSTCKVLVNQNLVKEIILITGYRQIDFVEDISKININHYLLKPLREECLIELVRSIFENIEDNNGYLDNTLKLNTKKLEAINI